jgi:Flp pilus assembly protein TadG
MTRMARLSRLLAATGGASAIEFALVAAFLILPLTLGVYDFATALYRWMEVGNAARAGASYINVNGYSKNYDTSTLSCSANNFTCAVQAATNLGSAVTVKVDPAGSYCGCQNGSTYTALTCAPATSCPPCNVCSSTYTSNCCPAGQTAVTLAKVTATYNYAPLFNYLGFGPANGFALSAQSTALLY